MSLLATIESWAADAEQAATAAVPVLGAASNALAAISNVAKLLDGFREAVQAPAMVNASEAQKLSLFHGMVQNMIASGDEAGLEKLESDSP
jgi:hypothetical protein